MLKPLIIRIYEKVSVGTSLTDHEMAFLRRLPQIEPFTRKVAIATMLSIVHTTDLKPILSVPIGSFVQYRDLLCSKTDTFEIYDWCDQSFKQIPDGFVFPLKEEELL